MRCKPCYTSGLVLLAMVALASPTAAQTVAAGPYYATPSWDQTLACTSLANCPRFIVLSNMNQEAVLDRETGLVWERSPSTSNSWFGAQTRCNRLAVGNRMGWRVPTLQELASLIDRSQSSPALPSGHPFNNVQSSSYWSATSNAIANDFGWSVFFGNGQAFTPDKPAILFIWCVRGGQGVDPQ